MLRRHITYAAFLLLPFYAQPAFSAADCSSLDQYAFNETWRAKYADILSCYRQGIDPPLAWRKGGGQGTSAGERGAAGSASSITGWRAPENPPVGGGPSLTPGGVNFAINFPPFPGHKNNGSTNGCVTVYAPPGSPTPPAAKCQLPTECIPNSDGVFPQGTTCTLNAGCPPVTVCPPPPTPTPGTPPGPGTVGFCPIVGERAPLSDTTLQCGGSLALNGMESRFINLMESPDHMLLLDHNVRQVHHYKKDTSTKSYKFGKTSPFPEYLCRWETQCDSDGNCELVKVRDVNLNPPVGQLFSYRNNVGTLYAKIISDAPHGIPLTMREEFVAKNKVLRMPIVSGDVYVPRDGSTGMDNCDLTVDYYVDEPKMTGFLSIHAFAQTACSRQQYFLGGACQSQIIQYSKNQPAMVILPNTKLSFFPVEGRSEVMVSANQDGIFAANYPSIFKLSQSGVFGFPNGAAVNYYGNSILAQDDEYIFASPPSITINAVNTSFAMPNGGFKRSVVSGITTQYPANSTLNNPYGMPHLVTIPDGISEFKGNMEYPTLNSSYINLPVVPPAGTVP